TRRIAEMRQLGVEIFFAGAMRTPKCKTPAGMRKRFVAQAMSKGIPLNDRKSNFSLPNALGLAAVALLVFAFVTASSGIEWFSKLAHRGESTQTASMFASQTKEIAVKEDAKSLVSEKALPNRSPGRRIVFSSYRQNSATSPSRVSKQGVADGLTA